MYSYCNLQHFSQKTHPTGTELHILAEIEELLEDRANVKMTLTADGKVCATGKGIFVAVKEGHPAYHRWS